MSGIAAVFDPAATEIQNEEILSAMLSKIEHRGDMEQAPKIRAFSYAVLGRRPLRALEEEQGDLFQAGEQDTVVAMMDGEIYNYQDLRQELIACGHQFLTFSNGELLAHSYREWQDRLVDHLDGMFAFIIYDSTTDIFLAARDHIGIKPLYFLQKAGAYFIASEMKALLMLGQDIHELQPGHVLKREGIHRYFSFAKQPVQGSESTLIATFKDLLLSAVKKQVQTELPIGIILSGGLDSTTLLSIASRYHRDITAFTVGFRGAADIEIAQRYCRDNGIPHYIIYLDIDDLIHDLPQITYYGEAFEAIDVMVSCIVAPAYKRAKEMGIKIMLCGDGSDELVAGYDFFKTHPDPDRLMLYRLSNIYRTDLRRIDRTGMRYGIETRLPFLDQAFMSLAYSLPMTMKLREGIDKWVLREALKDDLPDYIVHRPKVRLPDGTGLKYQLLNFARQQKIDIDPAILAQLHIDQADGAYFLAEYLKMGYPLPQDRYKKPGWDFASHGYFDFVT
jgi:asparagine synthase (glutamine-hydrolysing)